MKNLIKKNQLMITALAIMLAIAGYLQFAGTNLDEEYLDDSGKTAEVTNTDGVITDNVVAGQYSISDIDGMLDLSEADLVASSVTEIDSLDTDGDVIAENYLDSDMVVGEAGCIPPWAESGGIPPGGSAGLPPAPSASR